MVKDEDFICPNCSCGESEVEDTDFDGDYMIRKMYCPVCSAMWREYYRIEYDGYSRDGVSYDRYGNEEN